MFGIEIIAAVIGLVGIIAAYSIISYSLREKTYEEALAEQRGTRGEAGKAAKKDKTKKLKKKGQSDGGTSDAGSPVKERKAPAAAKEQLVRDSEKPKDILKAVQVAPEKSKRRADDSEVSADEGRTKPAKAPVAPTQKKVEKKAEKEPRKHEETYAEAVKQHLDETPVEKTNEQVMKGKENQEGRPKTKEHKPEAVKKERETLKETHVKNAPVEPEVMTKTEVRSEKSSKQEGRGGHKEEQKKVVTPAVNVNGPTSGSVYQEVMGLLKSIQLSDGETQKLFQVLIDKQSERHTEWVQLGKGKQVDPSTIAKRLIADREQELHDEKELNKALADQLKDMKNLLNAEKARLREVTEASRAGADRLPALESEIKNLNGRLKQGNDKHTTEITQWTQKLSEAESRASSKIHSLEERLREQSQLPAQNDSGELRTEFEAVRIERDRLVQELENQRSTIEHLEQQIKDLQQVEKDVHTQADNHSHDTDDEKHALLEELERLRNSTQTQVRDYNELEENVKNLNSTVSEKDSRLQRLAEELENLRGHSSEINRVNEGLKLQIEHVQKGGDQQGEVDNLHERITQLENALKEAEAKQDERLKEVRDEGYEEAKHYFEPQVNEGDKAYRAMLMRVIPDVHIESSLKAGDWITEFERSARDRLQSANNSEVSNLREQLDELRTAHEDAERYRSALTETEVKLRDLQRSVESEEEKWELVEKRASDYEDKCKHLETQLSEVVSEKDSAHKLLEERSSSVSELEHRLRESEDRLHAFTAVESNLKNLQDEAERMKADLAETRRHKDELQSEVTTLRENLSETERLRSEHEERIDTLLAEVNERRVSSGDSDDLRREVNDLRNSLEFERDNARKLAQEVIRSKSFIQSGLDALRKEEDTVLRLQQALEFHQHGVNGTDGGGDRVIHDTAHR